MSLDSATEYLKQFGVEDRIQVFDVSSATVDLAAQAVGVEGARIAKTLSFKGKEHPMLVVAAGDASLLPEMPGSITRNSNRNSA